MLRVRIRRFPSSPVKFGLGGSGTIITRILDGSGPLKVTVPAGEPAGAAMSAQPAVHLITSVSPAGNAKRFSAGAALSAATANGATPHKINPQSTLRMDGIRTLPVRR